MKILNNSYILINCRYRGIDVIEIYYIIEIYYNDGIVIKAFANEPGYKINIFKLDCLIRDIKLCLTRETFESKLGKELMKLYFYGNKNN